MATSKGTGPRPAKPRTLGTVIAEAKPAPAAGPSRIPGPDIKPAAVTVPPLSVIRAEAAAEQAEEVVVLKKQEMLERVVQRSGAKKRDVKPIAEAVLAVIGEALSNGEELNLPPLGKVKINRQKEDSSGEMIIVKLKRNTRQNSNQNPDAEGLAEEDEDD